jgi:hypothetical protein
VPGRPAAVRVVGRGEIADGGLVEGGLVDGRETLWADAAALVARRAHAPEGGCFASVAVAMQITTGGWYRPPFIGHSDTGNSDDRYGPRPGFSWTKPQWYNFERAQKMARERAEILVADPPAEDASDQVFLERAKRLSMDLKNWEPLVRCVAFVAFVAFVETLHLP